MASQLIGVNEVIRNIERWEDRKLDGLFALSENFGKGVLEGYAKRNRKWKDRTSSARNGLIGGAYKSGNNIHVFISHRVSYGVYLEKSRAGRYAILMPTIRANKQKYNDLILRYLNN